MRIFIRSGVPGKPNVAIEPTEGSTTASVVQNGGLATLGGDGVEEGGRLGVDLDRVQDVAAYALFKLCLKFIVKYI
jgi:hypothetical protein